MRLICFQHTISRDLQTMPCTPCLSPALLAQLMPAPYFHI
uniref:Uncharacterized protein n=1 Tax=Arundo donax TaxID=35708 RepID=A0A0A9AXL7_ARUDO